MNLSTTLQHQSGLRWVLDRLEPLSPFGRAALRDLPWYGPDQRALLEGELDNISRAMALLEESPAPLRTVSGCLPLFRDIRGSLDREAEQPFDLVELFELKYFLLTFRLFLGGYQKLSAFEGVCFAPMEEALALLDPSGRGLPSFSVEDSYHPDLPPLRREKRQAEDALRCADETARPGLTEARRVLAVREKELELAVRKDLTARLLPLREEFLANMAALGRLDLILAKAKLARKFRCVRPSVSEGQELTLRGLIHPQIAAEVESRGEVFHPVDLTLQRGCTVITGANMGGKTVSLRAAALSVLLCQCGFFLFADEAALPLFEDVGLILTDGGTGEGGLSSFGSEVFALNQLLRRCDGRFFFLGLDEFARGTNPQEGAALARALAGHLNGSNCVALMTTHYDGVSDAAGTHYQVAGLTRELSGDEGDDPRVRIARRMDYRLLPAAPGATCPRDALNVCRLLDLDENLLTLFGGNG